jgi:NAD+ kinase
LSSDKKQNMFQKIAFFLKNDISPKIAELVLDFLAKKNRSLYIVKIKGQKPWKDLSFIEASKADLIISFGGDGTILQLAKELHNLQTPILGINQGKIGFLTSVQDNDIIKSIEKIIIQEIYQMQKRIKIECNFDGNTFQALNDIVVKTSRIARIGDFTISHKNGESFSFRADGIILSTATGSTGYNLAAGGPILPHKSDLLVLTPICPYKYKVHSLILPKNEDTFINITKDDSPYGITIDGQKFIEFEDLNKTLIIKKSSKTLNIIYPEDFNFYNIIQTKLNFGEIFVK